MWATPTNHQIWWDNWNMQNADDDNMLAGTPKKRQSSSINRKNIFREMWTVGPMQASVEWAGFDCSYPFWYDENVDVDVDVDHEMHDNSFELYKIESNMYGSRIGCLTI